MSVLGFSALAASYNKSLQPTQNALFVFWMLSAYQKQPSHSGLLSLALGFENQKNINRTIMLQLILI